jgi:hypothetical protein
MASPYNSGMCITVKIHVLKNEKLCLYSGGTMTFGKITGGMQNEKG